MSYSIGLWRQRGDAVDKNGRPLGFIVPDVYAWPLGKRRRSTPCTAASPGWLTWIKNGGTAPSPVWYDRAPVSDYFKRSLFK